MRKDLVSIILVNYNSTQYLIDAVKSIHKQCSDVDYEIIVVDNASPDNGAALLRKTFGDKITLVENTENVGFGGANNVGYKASQGEYVFFLNPDTLLLNNAVSIFLDFMKMHKEEKIGGIGTILSDAQGQPINSYGHFITCDSVIKSYSKQKHKEKPTFNEQAFPVDFITGADLFTTRSVLEEVGMFDTRFFMYCEEVDLQKRMADAGYKRIIIPKARILHHDGGSYAKIRNRSARRRLQYGRSQIIYIKKHYGILARLLFRFRFAICRLPAVFNPHYSLKDNLRYLKMLMF